jgi:hypothetical protein
MSILLSPELTARVLCYLQLTPATPDLAMLDQLMLRYAQTVPWESASRIAKAAHTADYTEAPRWPAEFWENAIEYGTGGTCFESNNAFIALLKALGFDAYLTINNMGETIGCHTATIVQLGGEQWLADVGYPLYQPLPLDPRQPTTRATPYLTFHAEPQGEGHYRITKSPHPEPYMFDLIDQPVDEATYRAATINDYGPDGLFLNRFILRKIIGDSAWRFDSNVPEPVLQRFYDGQRSDTPIEGEPATVLSEHFGIDRAILATAFEALARQSRD